VRFEPLGKQARDQIQSAAVQVLEEIGFLVESPIVARRLEDAGFPSAGDRRYRIPRGKTEAALRSAPRSVCLGATARDKTVVLDGSRTYVTTDGCGSKTLDLESRTVRPSVLGDVADSARLTDALDHLDVYWSMVSAQDVPEQFRVGREFVTALRNSRKPVQMIDVSEAKEAEVLAGMGRILSEAGVIEGPPVSMLSSVVSPLRLDPGGTEAALVFAAHGLPVVAVSMPISSVTAPATAAGTLLLAHAEVMGFVTILQSLHPGCPVVYTPYPSFADPRTGATSYSDPRGGWAAAAAAQLGREVGLPTFTSGNQLAVLAQPDLISFGGLLERSTILALDQLVLDDETVYDYLQQVRDQEVSPESLAFDVIRDVGPGGHFLAQRHTVRHIREFVRYEYLDEPPVPELARGGRDGTARERARQRARQLLKEHVVEPLPEKVGAQLDKLAEQPARVTSG
jgi:trimethylamine--corrinoid protein Co-methyltransferase